MIPAWKLRRELTRLRGQILGIPRSLAALPKRLAEPGRRRAYDAAFPANLTLSHGDVAPGAKIAIVVLHQPHGIAASTFATCEWLLHEGYAPLVVSSAPISGTDRAALHRVAWQVAVRENFGHDFGSYRDGIRLIRDAGLSPDRLILLNDSIWCPLRADLMARIEAINADLSGLLQDEKVAHDDAGGTPTDRLYLESYFFVISGALWRSAAFQDFWTSYPMTDHKPDTIKRGEIGFSRSMQAAGFRLCALTDRARFLAAIAHADAQTLHQALRYAAYDDRGFADENADLLACFGTDDGWKAQARDHMRRWVNRRRFNSGFPLATATIFGMYFLKKKQGEEIFVAARRSYLRAVQDGHIAAPDAVFLSEIKASVPVPTA